MPREVERDADEAPGREQLRAVLDGGVAAVGAVAVEQHDQAAQAAVRGELRGPTVPAHASIRVSRLSGSPEVSRGVGVGVGRGSRDKLRVALGGAAARALAVDDLVRVGLPCRLRLRHNGRCAVAGALVECRGRGRRKKSRCTIH